jgi:hypothetical protein
MVALDWRAGGKRIRHEHQYLVRDPRTATLGPQPSDQGACYVAPLALQDASNLSGDFGIWARQSVVRDQFPQDQRKDAAVAQVAHFGLVVDARVG